MGRPVPPQGQPGDAADDRLRAEIESLQRVIGASVGDANKIESIMRKSNSNGS